ncbi:Pycsar system effector family protein [Streptomyces luteireticuli]|uniref:Pycsar system effector family protein n=1 Tax=Streptomyces luteireticuli TaxID=173858 RepID=UPI003557BC18
MTSTPANGHDDQGLDRALKGVTDALGKTDVKATCLLGAVIGLAALIRGALSDGPTAARATAGTAAAFLAAAIVFIVLAVLPRIPDDGTSFPHWGSLSPDEIRQVVLQDDRPQQVGVLSKLATAKFRHLQAATAATGAAALLLLLAGILAALG